MESKCSRYFFSYNSLPFIFAEIYLKELHSWDQLQRGHLQQNLLMMRQVLKAMVILMLLMTNRIQWHQ